MPPSRLSLALLTFPALSAFAPAQSYGGAAELLFGRDGIVVGGSLGAAVAAAGDVDGDGIPDLLAGEQAQPSQSAPGRVHLLSGRDGATIRVLMARSDEFGFGLAVASAGDLDGDGVPDQLVGARGSDYSHAVAAGVVDVFAGATGSLLHRFTGEGRFDHFGSAIAGGGDVDADGVPDVVVGAPDADPGGAANAGTVTVFSGRTGRVLFRWSGAAGDRLGGAVALGGDWNGDGRAEVLHGAEYASAHAGEVAVRSGADGRLLLRIVGDVPEMHLGHAVAVADDLDGDGIPEILAGGPSLRIAAYGYPGEAVLYSGATGARLQSFTGLAGTTRVGEQVAWLGDLDGDGVGELIYSWQQDGSGYPSVEGFAVLAAADGREWARIGPFPARVGSFALAAAGDLDGDGTREILIGAPDAGTSQSVAGRVEAWTFDPGLWLSRGTLSAANGGRIVLRCDFPSGAAWDRYQLLASRSGTGPTSLGGLLVPLGVDLVFRHTLRGHYPPQVRGGAGLLGAFGDAFASIAAAPGVIPPALVGARFHLAVVCEPLGGPPRYSSVARVLEIVP